MKTFPFEMYHPKFGAVLVRDEQDVENCVANGFSYDRFDRADSLLIKSKIAEMEADLAQLKVNLEIALQREAEKAVEEIIVTEVVEKEEEEEEV